MDVCLSTGSGISGMKAHIAIDANSGVVDTVLGTGSRVHDLSQVMQCCMARRRKYLPMWAIWGHSKDRKHNGCTLDHCLEAGSHAELGNIG